MPTALAARRLADVERPHVPSRLRGAAIVARVALVTLLLTGVVYPLAVTGLARVLFPGRSAGSLVADDRGVVVGSELLAQRFSGAAYLQPRPSAAGAGYDPLASGGSNLGPTSRTLHDRAAVEVARLLRENPEAPLPVPADLVAASGSGLDPHVSPAAARWQVPRIAQARHVAPERVQALVEASIEGRALGFLGEPHVNVLRFNLALDRRFGRVGPPVGPPAPDAGRAP